MVCRRDNGDKLLCALALKWSVNLFRVPRPGIDVADVFVLNKRDLDQWKSLADLYGEDFQLPNPKSGIVGEMQGVESKSYGARAGFEALEGLLAGLGVPVPMRAGLKAARNSDAELSFRVGQVKRTGLLPGTIRDEMEAQQRSYKRGGLDPGRRYVVAHAVWEAKELVVKLAGNKRTTADLTARLVALADGLVGTTAERDSSGWIRYRKRNYIAFGIQVTAVRFDDGGGLHLEGAPDPTPRLVRLAPEVAKASADEDRREERSGLLIGLDSGSPFVTVRGHD
jgi:hypothetical protein